MRTGIKDIAALAGVSVATVSRVLAGKSVRPSYRARVEEALRHIDYRPNLAARRLRAPDAGPIGIIVPDLANSFFANFVRMIEELAWTERLRVVVCDSNHDSARERRHQQMLEEERVSGLLIAPVASNADRLTSLPTVLFDRGEAEPCDTVTIDNEAAAAALAASVRQAGARSILTLIGDDSTTARARACGLVSHARDHGLIYRCAQVPSEPQARRKSVLAALSAAPDTEAVIAMNDDVLLDATVVMGINTPRILACFDDAKWLRLRTSKLHIVAQPVMEIAHAALALLIQRIAGYNGAPRRLAFQGSIIKR